MEQFENTDLIQSFIVSLGEEHHLYSFLGQEWGTLRNSKLTIEDSEHPYSIGNGECQARERWANSSVRGPLLKNNIPATLSGGLGQDLWGFSIQKLASRWLGAVIMRICILRWVILSLQSYKNLWVFLFCFVVCFLKKNPQPQLYCFLQEALGLWQLHGDWYWEELSTWFNSLLWPSYIS